MFSLLRIAVNVATLRGHSGTLAQARVTTWEMDWRRATDLLQSKHDPNAPVSDCRALAGLLASNVIGTATGVARLRSRIVARAVEVSVDRVRLDLVAVRVDQPVVVEVD